MNNMFDILKQHNSESIISVRHYASYYPEIVGYKGNVYQIPNENVANKIKRPKIVEKQVDCFTIGEQKKIEQYVLHSPKDKLFGVVLCLYTGFHPRK